MKKILIWNYRELANTGGPKGYLYNIHEALKLENQYNITFLSDLITPIPDKKATKQKISNSLFYKILKDIKHIYTLCWGYYHKEMVDMPIDLDIDDFDFVHIHWVYDVYTFRRTFPNYKGKVILTTHCPCPWTDEMLSQNDKFVSLFRNIILNWECKAYKQIDYLMFPCKGAREPYEKDKKIQKLFSSIEHKFIYVPSAIMDIPIEPNMIQKFSDLGIPDDAFVISYFGRHNKVKGYDIIKQVGQKLLEKYRNLYFLCAGRIDIQPLNHERWIELGFIGNTHELLYQSDLYISANRDTYFDLVVLEILRSSTKLILSSTGGNNFFKFLSKENTRGILFFENENLSELETLVENCILEKMNNYDEFRKDCEANRELFLNQFTLRSFLENYSKTLEKI